MTPSSEPASGAPQDRRADSRAAERLEQLYWKKNWSAEQVKETDMIWTAELWSDSNDDSQPLVGPGGEVVVSDQKRGLLIFSPEGEELARLSPTTTGVPVTAR